MEDWKKAYKAIHGRTPTKKEVTLAPKALRGESPKYVQNLSTKSKTLKRPVDSSFMSPVKKRRLLDSMKSASNVIISPTKTVTIKMNDKENVKMAECTPTTSTPLLLTDESIKLLSPCKNWTQRNASPKKTPQKKPLLFYPKSPSPMKPLGKNIICRNIKFLMDVKTPEKNAKSGDGEQEEEETFIDEKPENAKPHRENAPKRKKDNGNFVRCNLRKRNFVKGKPSKFSKKKWLKYKKRT